jgi:hypothetical protein
MMVGANNGKANNSKRVKGARNFNFRCNLDAIDKIIEEDVEKNDEKEPDIESIPLEEKIKKKEPSVTR